MITEEVRKLIQALSRTQVSGGGNAGAGERIMYANLNMPVSDNTSFDVGVNSVKVPGLNKNEITNFGVNHRTNNGVQVGANFNPMRNNRGGMFTIGTEFE